jgi:6-phosphogluconolactonase
MLTGGRNAVLLYQAWSELLLFQQLKDVSFYFGDERCVPPDDANSNYGMAMRSLFQRGVPADCSVFRMEADDPDLEAAALRYGDALPAKLDVILLGVGEDGHIASLFPGSAALHEKHRRVMSIIGPKPPHQRLTITPSVIAQAKYVFVLAAGAAKAAVLSDALQAPNDFDIMPARLVLNATWLLDAELPETMVY